MKVNFKSINDLNFLFLPLDRNFFLIPQEQDLTGITTSKHKVLYGGSWTNPLKTTALMQTVPLI